ncbi:DNA topoisomerase I [Candidatus Bathyarchaeota archaeon]|nr:DNA topoisomerase I [Candidatus Bathyarchaeota archaeon]
MAEENVLILCEKPSTAERVAKALDENGKPRKNETNGVPHYEAYRAGKRLTVVAALGHLYTVAPKVTDRNVYPVFEFEWVPRYVAERDAKDTRTWIEVISTLSKDADEFILATDYDIEGATLGYTILKYACGEKDKEAKRMKFSTLTTDELKKSYAEIIEHIEFPIVEAGVCRHFLDAMYGINLSRAMTVAAKKWSGKYLTLSTGRVQGPTLKFLVDREKTINTFVPIPFWAIKATVEINGQTFDVEYEKDKIESRNEAEAVLNACKGKKGTITDVEVKKFRQNPPVPFDLGALQAEAYSFFKYTPKRTSDIAERLYLEALISYPRTSSQKIPPSINSRAILESLSQDLKYKGLAEQLLGEQKLVPNEGKKDDPAHPSIYPTGNLPGKALGEPERKLWDLIVRRFMAVFGKPALKQSAKATISIDGHKFFLYGKQVLEEGWMVFYRPFIQLEEVLLPHLEKGQEITFREISVEDRFTKPPPRYNPSSLLKKMEDEGIGTKATRAGIIDTLYSRGYVTGERATVSELGLDVIDILERHCPEVISISFTKELEDNMEEIQKGIRTTEEILEKAKSRLEPVLTEMKKEQEILGQELSEAAKNAQMQRRVIGGCLQCGTGKLIVLYSKKTGKRFLGCSNFFIGKCKTSFPLPQTGTIKSAGKNCDFCGWPMVQFRAKGKRPLVFCVRPECPSREARK